MSVTSAAKRLVTSLASAFAWAGFYLLRFGERVLPLRVLSLLLWPPAAAWDLVQLRQRKLVTAWRCFPESWHPNPRRFFLRQSLGLYHAQLIYIWPDRLCTPRWLSRCRLEGRCDLVRSQKQDRPIILASLHFGPSEILPYWLRAHGIVTTTIRGLTPDSLQGLTSYQYALSPPADVPVFLYVNEMSRVRQFLSPGRRLLVMVDYDRGKQLYVPFENRLFRMATGAIRLAALAGAELVPCLICETGSWKFVIHFGDPVPQHLVGSSPDLKAVAGHLLREFSKVITRYPEQCKSRLLSAMSSPAGDRIGDISAVPCAPESH